MNIDFDCNSTLFSCTSLDAWMITSTAARIELLVWKANARSSICAHCVQSADLQVCCPTSFTSLPNDLSPEGPAAVGVAHRIFSTCFPSVFLNLFHQQHIFSNKICGDDRKLSSRFSMRYHIKIMKRLLSGFCGVRNTCLCEMLDRWRIQPKFRQTAGWWPETFFWRTQDPNPNKA